ncbi:hypothetical protein J2S51_000467 [Streptomyces sp. DSM 41269]|nr:hypothetical protein [Streptomyces sp. DSM 41269]
MRGSARARRHRARAALRLKREALDAAEGCGGRSRSTPGARPEVYRRYGHWWGRLPDATVRLLPGG